MADLTHIAKLLSAGDEKGASQALAAMNDIQYELLRQPLAKETGVRPAVLDKLRAPAAPAAAMQGTALALESPEPATESQTLADLLDDVERQVRRFVVADDASIVAVALWCSWAYLIDRAPVAPMLNFTSPTRACGKSTALEVVARLTPRSLPVSGVSPAAVFRTIEMMMPTLVIDEADTLFRTSDELRTLLNGGFTRLAARVIRIAGEDLEPRIFSTWCPKVLAGIGKLPDTLTSRSIVVPMRRKRADERCERLRADRDMGFGALRSRLARWALDDADDVVSLDPDVPAALSDRQADCWRELLRIADAAGGRWPDVARGAALAICGRDDEETDTGARLLADLRALFATEPHLTAWPSQRICDALNALESSPWPDFDHGRGLKPARLAKLCGRFGVQPKTIRAGGATPKGYHVADFSDLFGRYLAVNRNTATSGTNSPLHNDIRCGGNVAVADVKRNTTGDGGGCGVSETQPQHLPQHNKSIPYKEIRGNVALWRHVAEPDPLAALDGLFDEGGTV